MPAQEPAFPGEASTVWTYSEVAEQFYYHDFYHFQPSLNLSNAAVRQELSRIARFWLDKGVSGFRVDAIGLLLKEKGSVRIKDPIAFLIELHQAVHGHSPEAVLLGEADVPLRQYPLFYNQGQGMDLLLNFHLVQHAFLAFAHQTAKPLIRALQAMCKTLGSRQWVMFLRNLDELNVGRRVSVETRFEAYVLNRSKRKKVSLCGFALDCRPSLPFSVVQFLWGYLATVRVIQLATQIEPRSAGNTPPRVPSHQT